MAIERTFSMIKPDATKRNLTGAITKVFEDNGLRIIASKRVWMSKREAEGFYAVHKDRPFFGELVEGMTSGPTIVQVLEGEGAILKNREIMGATNPANATKARSASSSPCRSAKTRFTVRTLRKPLPRKSPTGSLKPKSSAESKSQRPDLKRLTLLKKGRLRKRRPFSFWGTSPRTSCVILGLVPNMTKEREVPHSRAYRARHIGQSASPEKSVVPSALNTSGLGV